MTFIAGSKSNIIVVFESLSDHILSVSHVFKFLACPILFDETSDVKRLELVEGLDSHPFIYGTITNDYKSYLVPPQSS